MELLAKSLDRTIKPVGRTYGRLKPVLQTKSFFQHFAGMLAGALRVFVGAEHAGELFDSGLFVQGVHFGEGSLVFDMF